LQRTNFTSHGKVVLVMERLGVAIIIQLFLDTADRKFPEHSKPGAHFVYLLAIHLVAPFLSMFIHNGLGPCLSQVYPFEQILWRFAQLAPSGIFFLHTLPRQTRLPKQSESDPHDPPSRVVRANARERKAVADSTKIRLRLEPLRC